MASDRRLATLNRTFALGIDPHPLFGVNGLGAAAKSGSPELVALMLRYDKRVHRQQGSYNAIELAEGRGRRRPDPPTADRPRSVELLKKASAR